MTLPQALEQAERLALEWAELARLFEAKGLEVQEAMAQISALVAIENAKEGT